jgi:hypothetical protein
MLQGKLRQDFSGTRLISRKNEGCHAKENQHDSHVGIKWIWRGTINPDWTVDASPRIESQQEFYDAQCD